MRLTNFFAELKRRKVYRVAISYAVVAWLLIQIATQVFPFLDVPNWAIRLVIILISLGCPIALVLAWAFDLTPQGVKRTEDLPAAPNEQLSRAAQEEIPQKSIAVLPFENLSDDPHNAHVADGIQDDILANLAKIADLKVISRTSVRQYKTGARNLRDIGRELRVAHILEGSVRAVGNRLRVNAQLINAGTDTHVWAETFDRQVTDLFALQSELAERITLALRANLSPQEKASLRIHSTSNLEAYENYLRARDLFRWSGAGDPHENGERALRCLERATELDPNFALAYTLAARWHGELFWFGFDRSDERLRKMKLNAETALRLQPDLGAAHLAFAYYYYLGFRDYAQARAKAEEARRLTPNDAEAYNIVATMNRRQGRWDESLATFEQSLELDPRNVSVMWDLAESCVAVRRDADAERVIAQALAINPEAHLFRLLRGTIALRSRGEVAPMREALHEIPREFDPGGSVTLMAVRIGLMEGNPAAAEESLGGHPHERYNDSGVGGIAGTLDGYSFPPEWLRGLIARARGDHETARQQFEVALDAVERDVNCCSEDAKSLMMCGLVHAALGHHDEAIRHGERAAALLPIERDAYDGPALATNLAAIYAQVGEKDRALDLLGKLRGVPMAATAGTLRVERDWDSLRDDPRFTSLL